ncbi:hypothetical protein [Aminobacter sp. LjRoot7]|uniref:hypothetical protein n=1 Tax=Aminobacter sp. LjRoot7 TaxID=3342335 RepID=UPI003ED15BEE
MKLRFLFALFSISTGLFIGFQQAATAACVVPSYNQKRGIPPGFTEPQGFKGRFDFPASTSEPLPAFLSIDFTQDWRAYIQAVLEYSFEGNIAVDFKVANNNTRNWYHALWMHPGNSGREFLHGLTKERATDPEQLAEGVTKSFDTWAVGFYNALGATTFAKVWSDPCSPKIDDIYFPVGTTSFKLLFTTATATDIPYLAGAPEWDGDIGRAPNRIGKLRLYQIDMAVRDPRSLQTGWVFGTFVYQGDEPGTDPWKKLVPVGLSWGNDRFVPPPGQLRQNVLNDTLEGKIYGWPARKELGWGGRVNGPADNQISSCVSCHGSAQYPRSDDFGNLPRQPATPVDYQRRLLEYFRDIFAGGVFDGESRYFGTQTAVLARPLDYSLQLQAGIERMCATVTAREAPFNDGTVPVPPVCPAPPAVVAGGPESLSAGPALADREDTIDALLEPIR